MNPWNRFAAWMSRGFDRLRPAPARVVALSWVAVATLSVLLGSGLAAAWSAVSKPGAASLHSDERVETASPASSLAETLRSLARDAMESVYSMDSTHHEKDRTQAKVQARLAADSSPEGRLLKAYQALQDGQSPQALEQVSKLVSDHPEFSLAQLLYADLLAARIGQPRAFGVSPQSTPHPADRRLALLEEARRRWSAVHEGPPAGHLPMEFVRIAPDVRHAVAIDASRSRLYLFENGPNGLSLKKDIYVSVGKQGVGKRLEGDQRTPLGVYWITNTFKGPMHDPRLGQAALGINYPNVWDRHLGRTGSGLFLHGVPSELLAHVPQATDGCVAMSNDEATALLATVDPGTTPVLIAWSLEWVPAERVGGHHRGFLEAYGSWEQARQRGDQVAASVWYDGRTPIFATPTAGAASPPTILAWLGDGVPVMVVSTTHPYIDDGQPGMWRQYWTQLDGQWRIFFDNLVEIRGNRQALEGSRSSSQSRKSRERSG